MIRTVAIVCLALATGFPVSAQMTRPEVRNVSLSDWQAEFRGKALAAGISAQVFDTAFTSVRYNTNTRETDANQVEFVRPIWEYFDTAVSSRNIATGREKSHEYAALLRDLERKYRIPTATLLAIWGMETNYGSFRGRTNTIEALANVAHDGRRRDFAEKELIAALQIISAGEITPQNMLGGWSGAMGHTQFMPTTYLQYAQDQNSDGRRNVWSDDPSDALASTAYYLNRLGWNSSAPWGVEVTLPTGFDLALIGEYGTQTASFWNARGVRNMQGGQISNHGATALIAPAGRHGPIFVIFPNFQVIRQYNMSVAYSLAVGRLSDRIAGAGPLNAGWPRSDSPLTRDQTREIQQRLNAIGLDTGGVDGMIGPKTVEAIQVFQQRTGLPADGYATVEMLRALRR